MKIHLVDGTCELSRSYFGTPPKKAPDGREVGATIGLLRILFMLASTPGVTHVACAFDQVIESFRNELFPGHKTGEGVAPDLLAQLLLAERAVFALGIVVWPMVEFKADDALATAASRFKDEPGVEQVVLCSPDKDLAQSVCGASVICWDRRRDILLDEDGVFRKFGVRPRSIPDWLALVGDAADGIPWLPGWGPSRPRQCSRASTISRSSRRTPAGWIFPSAARPASWRASRRTARRPCSTDAWRLSASTFRWRKGRPTWSGEAPSRS